MADCLHVRSFIIIHQEYHKLITTPRTTHLHLSLKPRYFRFMTLKFYCSETLRPHCCLYSHVQRSPPTTAFYDFINFSQTLSNIIVTRVRIMGNNVK